jgi:hypothetical protein
MICRNRGVGMKFSAIKTVENERVTDDRNYAHVRRFFFPHKEHDSESRIFTTMREIIKKLIYLTAMLHLVLIALGTINLSVCCWGLVMQVLYLACLEDIEEERYQTLIVFVTCGTIFVRDVLE